MKALLFLRNMDHPERDNRHVELRAHPIRSGYPRHRLHRCGSSASGRTRSSCRVVCGPNCSRGVAATELSMRAAKLVECPIGTQ